MMHPHMINEFVRCVIDGTKSVTDGCRCRGAHFGGGHMRS